MKLSSRDKDKMIKDVNNIINDWGVLIDIKTPLPIDQQSNWNPLLREINGPIVYNIQSNVPAERRDIILSDVESNNSGDKFNGHLFLHLPLSYKYNDIDTDINITKESIIVYNNEEWRIDELSDPLGQYIIHAIKIVGDD